MRRSPTMKGLVLVAAAAFALAACSAKSAGTAPASSGSSAVPATSGAASSSPQGSSMTAPPNAAAVPGSLSIQPLSEISPSGALVAAVDGAAPADPAGDGKASCTGMNIGFAGALTGANAALGTNIVDGGKVAIQAHNKANPGCQVSIKPFDTEGDPQKATQVAPSIVADTSVIGLLGPAFSGETKATEPIFFQAGLASLTPSATNPKLTTNGWTNFFRGVANDNSLGTAVVNYLLKTSGDKKVCIVQDDSDYGVGVAALLTKGLASVADNACAGKVKTGDKDFSVIVNQIKSESPDAVFYAGYYPEAAPFVTQLRGAGVTAAFVSDDGTNDPQFVKQAGSAAKGALLTCLCGPAPAAFTTAYKALNGASPGVYSVEGYDMVTVMLKGIDSAVKTRKAMIDYVRSYSGVGLAKSYKWNSTGELAAPNPWVYEVK